jgi:hypothetical protein
MREADTLRSGNAASPIRGAGRLVVAMLIGAMLLAGLIALATSPGGYEGRKSAGATGIPSASAPRAAAISDRSAPTPDAVRRDDLRDSANAAAVDFSRRQRFEQSDDLYAFAQTLAPAVDRGEPDAIWLMSRVIDACVGHAADPAGFARDSERLGGLRIAAAGTIRAARERVQERCRRFTAADGLSPSAAGRLRLDAATAGSLVAEAELFGMGQPLIDGQDYANEFVARVRDSLDAEAFRAISPAMSGGDGFGVFSQPDIAPQFRELVWQLAACRLGLDCGPDSALMTSYCVNGGICSRDRHQGFEEFVYDAAIPRQSADLVRRMVDMLVRGNGNGG